jgi:lantibiotic modifying enzyme
VNNGWIGVDLDGTLARYDGWQGELHIGEPIEPMVKRVTAWLAQGIEVRIFTARVSANQGRTTETVKEIERTIKEWCLKHIGIALTVTCCKDFGMIELYDDRCKQVIPNTGLLVEEIGNG